MTKAMRFSVQVVRFAASVTVGLLASIVLPLQADVLIDAIQSGGVTHQCGRMVDGQFQVISEHYNERKAVASCTTEKVKDLQGDYRVRPTGEIRIVVTPEAAAQLYPVIQDTDSPGEVGQAPGSDWKCVEIGAGTGCNTFADDAGELNIDCAGLDQDNACFIYQEVSAASDIELIYRVTADSDFSGGTQTGLGPFVAGAIRNGITAGNPSVLLRWQHNSTRNNGNYRVSQDGAVTGGLLGDNTFATPFFAAIQRDQSSDTSLMWETETPSPDPATDWSEIGAGINLEGGFAGTVHVGFIVVSNHATNTVSPVIDTASIGSALTLTASNPPQTPNRVGLTFELDWETGALQPRDFSVNGVAKDAARVRQLEHHLTCTVTNITNASQAVATITGTGCAGGALANDKAITFGTVSSGMTQVSGRLFRVRHVSGNNYNLRNDGVNATGESDGDDILSDSVTNSSGWGTWSGNHEVKTWRQLDLLNGGMGPNSGLDVLVTQSFNPPANAAGAGSVVTPIAGDYMQCAAINRFHDYSEFAGNNNKNKPRTNIVPCDGFNTDNVCMIPYNSEFFTGGLIYFPDNYQHFLSSMTGNKSQNQVWQFADLGESGAGHTFQVVTEAHASGIDHLIAVVDPNGGDIDYDIGAVEPGEWTAIVVNGRIHTSTGFVQVWRSTGGCNSAGDCPMSRVVNHTGGFGSNANFGALAQLRVYKFGWNHHAGSPLGPYSHCNDEYRLGLSSNGASYNDVHPFFLDPP